MIRIVLDTNVLISALLNRNGLPAQVFLLATFDPEIELCVSADIYTEYEEVLRRPRLKRSEIEIESALRAIRERSRWVTPDVRTNACFDPDDDIFLECAQSASAHCLVTGNVKHFPDNWLQTIILTPRQFLELLI